MCSVIIFFSVYDKNFEVNLRLLIKLFSYMTKKVRAKIQITSEKMAFKVNFSLFLSASVARNCLRPGCVPLILMENQVAMVNSCASRGF